MSTPHTPMDPADEPDPTGMRAMLRALPDPGPMPQDLADRIKASLAAEQAARTTAPGKPAAAAQAPVDLAAYRHRRRRTPLLAAAASIMAVAGVGVVTMTGMPSAVVAIVTGGGSQDSSAAAVGAPEAAADSQLRSGQDLADSSSSRSANPGAAGSPRLSASGREWSTDSLAEAAPGLLDGPTTTPQTLASPSPGLDAVTTASGATDCATALGLDSSGGLAVDLGTHGGVPIVALAARSSLGQITVVIAERACGLDRHVVVQGPVSLP
ncbi:MAG: hypothetical protein KBB39_14815 [Phycicoccus sp.]|nr:hypothetical protein [Phycicoccus sp.]